MLWLEVGVTDLTPENEALNWVLSFAEGLRDFGPVQWMSRLVGEY